MSAPRVQHLVETRFSLGAERLTRAWLEERLELLRRYTLPSIAAQTGSSFTWLLLCGESTDPEVLERLREERRRLPALELVPTAADRGPLQVVRERVRRDADVLITTRLDSDDAIADRYLEAVQEYAGPFHRSRHERLLVAFPAGYRLDTREGSRLHRAWTPNAPFHSLFERPRRAAPWTVRGRWGHSDLHLHCPTHQDASLRAWLKVIHGGNILDYRPPRPPEFPPGAAPAGFTLGEGAVPPG